MLPLYVLKIGGSCLTYKRENLQKLRKGFLSRLSKEIKESQTKRLFSLIIIHGGGSITHPLLDRYQIAQKCKTGVISSQSEKVAAAKIHLAMSLLNKEVVQVLLCQGVPVWPIQTSALFTSSNRNIKKVFFESITLAIERGYIPILHGDFILDHKKTICICSGDLVGCILAKKLSAKKLLFASDTDGVYSDDPRYVTDAVFLQSLSAADFEIITTSSGRQFDHSGGMTAKLEYIKKYCKNTEVIIFNGLRKNNVKKVLLGESIGTTIKT